MTVQKRTPQPWRIKAHPNAKAETKPDPKADPEIGIVEVESKPSAGKKSDAKK